MYLKKMSRFCKKKESPCQIQGKHSGSDEEEEDGEGEGDTMGVVPLVELLITIEEVLPSSVTASGY